MVTLRELYNNIRQLLLINYSDKVEDETLLPDTIFNEVEYVNGDVKVKE